MTLQPRERRPEIDGAEALEKSKNDRIAAAKLSVDQKVRPAPIVLSNQEEVTYADGPISSFTKGLPHDINGMPDIEAYERFVRALGKTHHPDDQGGFPAPLGVEHQDKCWPEGYAPATAVKKHFFKTAIPPKSDTRRWESPLGGLNGVIEGPATAGVAMAPAPKMGSSELCAEMAEVYAMALIRDVPFSQLEDPNTRFTLPDGSSHTIGELHAELSNLSWFNPHGTPVSSDQNADGTFKTSLNEQEARRREARFIDKEFTLASLFRGSSYGAKRGPYVSQFMLQGSGGSGDIGFGTQKIDQKTTPLEKGVDYMTEWHEWLDVQNGANFRGIAKTEAPRFLTTPRDLASYVQKDQLYQAYFNAALILLGKEWQFDHGFPNSNQGGTRKTTREGFATWGGPHILALFAEVSSRALKAVRRQKFQIHRRARPEVIAARLAVAYSGHGHTLGAAEPRIQSMLAELTRDCPKLLEWIVTLNNSNRSAVNRGLNRAVDKNKLPKAPIDPAKNILLPMAFPEGSPMHPAYGAGHATVAGACVTVLKAMFHVVGNNNKSVSMERAGFNDIVVGDDQNLAPSGYHPADLFLQHELDKLAANISIARNMAGVHYYTDYYDSLRMGERIAVGILEEQLLTTPEKVCMSFTNFDGEHTVITGKPALHSSEPNQTHITVTGEADFKDWWTRHLP